MNPNQTKPNYSWRDKEVHTFPKGISLKGFTLVSLFDDNSAFMGYLIPKPSLKKDNSGTMKPIAGGIRGFRLFSLENIMDQLEFELANDHVTI